MIAPELSPRLALGHGRAWAELADLWVEVARLLRRQMIALDSPCGDQKVRVDVGGFAVLIAVMGGMNVELDRQALRHEMLARETLDQRDAVLMGQLGIGGQRDHQLARDLRVAPPLRHFGRVPQRGRIGKARIGTFRQQHRMMIGRVAVRERKALAGAFVVNGFASIIRGRARRDPAGRA